VRPQTAEYLKLFDQYYDGPEEEFEDILDPAPDSSNPLDFLKSFTDILLHPMENGRDNRGFFRRIADLFESAERPTANIWDRRTRGAMLWRLLLIKELGRDPTKHELKERLEHIDPVLYPPTIRWADLWKKPGLENLPHAKPRKREEEEALVEEKLAEAEL